MLNSVIKSTFSSTFSLGIKPILATPFVRGIAKREKIDLNLINPSGKFGNITENDLIFFKNKPIETKKIEKKIEKENVSISSEHPAFKYEIPPIELMEDDLIEPIRGLKRTMVKTMQLSCLVPHTGCFDDFCVDSLIELRNVLRPMALEKGVKLSYTAFFVKAASLALSHYPIINSTLSHDHKNIIFHKSHNIGIAMDTPGGLIVPNIKNCEKKSIFEIARDLNRLADLGQKGKLNTDDLKFGTFTLSNVGPITGCTYARPLLMPNETAIGALTDFKKYPRVDEKTNTVVIKSIMHVSWSCDHRTVEGATLLRFSNQMKSYIENPTQMLAEMK